MTRSRERTGTGIRGDDGRTGAVEQLQGELARGDLARHLAFFYHSRQTQLKVAAAFVDHALRTNNRCLYFLDSNTRAELEPALRSVGVDVAAREAAGDLVIERGADVYGQAGFDPDRLVADLEDAAHGSVADGYDGLWMAGETTWCFHTESSYDHVIDFEADFDAACPDLPVTALCQYDLGRFSEESVAKALWTHEQVVYRYRVCDNPFYVPPAEYRAGEPRPLNTQLMLEQIHELAAARKRLEQHEQRLGVVNRVLRHNIRNDVNVVRGIVELLEDEDLPPEAQERLATASTHLDEVFDIAEKARYVERTIERTECGRTDLRAVLTEARETLEANYPDAEVVVEGADAGPVVADVELPTAFVELGLYAFRQQSGTPSLSLTVSEPSPEFVRVDFAYPGPPVPENDRRPLESGVETPLQHGKGLGLWLAKWVVENSHGRLDCPPDGDPQFRVELYRVTDRP